MTFNTFDDENGASCQLTPSETREVMDFMRKSTRQQGVVVRVTDNEIRFSIGTMALVLTDTGGGR